MVNKNVNKKRFKTGAVVSSLLVVGLLTGCTASSDDKTSGSGGENEKVFIPDFSVVEEKTSVEEYDSTDDYVTGGDEVLKENWGKIVPDNVPPLETKGAYVSYNKNNSGLIVYDKSLNVKQLSDYGEKLIGEGYEFFTADEQPNSVFYEKGAIIIELAFNVAQFNEPEYDGGNLIRVYVKPTINSDDPAYTDAPAAPSEE